MRSPEQIVADFNDRRAARSPVIDGMIEVRDAYNGDFVVPLPELDRAEKSAVANLITVGIDKTANKVASVQPNLWYPALEPGKKSSDKMAATRRRANLGWWDVNRIGLKNRRRARHLIGYGCSPVILRPDKTLGCARWELRDPLTAFPAASPDPDELTPLNIIFSFQRTLAWLNSNYPDHTAQLHKGKNPNQNDIYTLLEYADGEETVLLVIGQVRDEREDPRSAPAGSAQVELSRVKNRTGMCLAVMPGRVTLNRMMGQFDQLIGMQELSAKLMALEYIAVEKGVFPDLYLVGDGNQTPRFVSGPHDGRSGLVNIVEGGKMQEMQSTPGYKTDQMMDRLERNARVTGSVAPEMGGESATNVRTGKRGDAILAEVIDTVVQEAQEIMALSAMEENRRAVAIAKAYFGDTKKTFYIGSAGSAKRVDYTPNKDFETDYNIVTYPMAGTDANGLIVGAGQRIGLGTMSKRGFMELDPMISDPERELDRVQSEALEAAALQAIQQQAASGTLPLADVARIMELIATDKADLLTAVQTAQKEAQARQATPVPMGDPAAQPGLGTEGDGAAAPVEPQTVGAPSQNIGNLAAMIGQLRKSGGSTRPSAPVGA